jgi:hypothetical protein
VIFVGGSLLFLVLVAKKGEKVSYHGYHGSTFYLCNEHWFVIIISLSCDACMALKL